MSIPPWRLLYFKKLPKKSSPMSNSKQILQPLDRAALGLMLVLIILISGMVWSGNKAAGSVRDFSWENKQVGADDASFSITFSRPMDRDSVQSSIKIEPLLTGKTSWAGRRMVYTLTAPAYYGNDYKIQLSGAKDQFGGEGGEKTGKPIKPFVGQFHTRDRVFTYIGIDGEEKGRLILYNVIKNQKNVLTPASLAVTDYKPYPDEDRILFAASEWTNQKPGVFEQQLYTVTTGININSPGKPETKQIPSGKIELVLDSKDYQNMKFDLSPDGKTIVVQRVKRGNPEQFGLWVVRAGSPPLPLENQPGGDFVVAPDSNSVAVAQGQGIAILPLQPQAKPIDFLPQFGKVLSFSKDGTAAAMIKFNSDYTRSLFLVTTSGVKKELLNTPGSIMDAEFDPMATTLYCLLTQLQKGEKDEEQPYVAAIDINTGKQTPMLALPNQRDIQMSLAPDGLALLFDQVVTAQELPQPGSLTTNEGQAISTGVLWLLPITPSNSEPKDKSGDTPLPQPQKLPLPGFHPTWMP